MLRSDFQDYNLVLREFQPLQGMYRNTSDRLSILVMYHRQTTTFQIIMAKPTHPLLDPEFNPDEILLRLLTYK